jgi:hypothetical protein
MVKPTDPQPPAAVMDPAVNWLPGDAIPPAADPQPPAALGYPLAVARGPWPVVRFAALIRTQSARSRPQPPAAARSRTQLGRSRPWSVVRGPWGPLSNIASVSVVVSAH